jgi:Ni,Fe-hydrogenase III component G
MTIQELEIKANKITQALHELVDDSITLRKMSESNKKEVSKIWQSFLGDFIQYIKYKSKETKENLLSSINFTKLR